MVRIIVSAVVALLVCGAVAWLISVESTTPVSFQEVVDVANNRDLPGVNRLIDALEHERKRGDDLNFLKGVRSLLSDRPGTAIIHFGKLQPAGPIEKPLLKFTGEALYKDGDPAEAEHCFKRLERIDPDSPDVRQWLAKIEQDRTDAESDEDGTENESVAEQESSAANGSSTDKPNILFIYTDDHSHRTVGCYPESYPFVKTPHIDQLANNGVRFRYCYNGTWCMPSRATLLTGLYQHGIESMRMEGTYPGSTYDPKKCPFWPSVFRANGYQTAHIGKWHTGTDTGFGRDWDYQIVWNRPGHPTNAGNYYKDQMTEFNGAPAKMVKGYTTDNYTDWALEYLDGKGRKDDKPWYLWLCYGAVHGPFTPADRHLDDYPGLEVPIPADIFPPRSGKPAYVQQRNSWYKGEDGKPHLKGRVRATGEQSSGTGIHGSTLNDWVRQYHQGVRALDESVGKLVARLKETGQYDNTLIVFTSDQGIAFGQHGFRIKVAPYDANIRSPLIVSMPSRIPEGKTCDTPIGGPDLVPTFFDFANIDLPWKMHGQSITPLLQKPDQPWSRPLLMTFTGNSFGSDTDRIPTDPDALTKIGKVPWYAFLHDSRLKYIRTFVEGETEELYDLETDPEELTNLVGQPKYNATLTKMRENMIKELRRTDAGFVDGLPDIKTDH